MSQWAEKFDLPALLAKGGGFAEIPNALPECVAEYALDALTKLSAKKWEQTSSADRNDAEYGDSIPHHFSLFEVEGHAPMLSVSRFLWRFWPQTLPNFTAALYTNSDHIAPHDDLVVEDYMWNEVKQLHADYVPDGGPLHRRQPFGLCRWPGLRPFERKIAAVYYLNKAWPKDAGGFFVDLPTGRRFPPAFNTLIVFEVPRMHEVTKVANGMRRFSIFGWWLVPRDVREDERAAVTKAKRAVLKRPAASAESSHVLRRPAAVESTIATDVAQDAGGAGSSGKRARATS